MAFVEDESMLVRLSGRLISQFLSIVSGSLSTEPPQLIRLPVRLIKTKSPMAYLRAGMMIGAAPRPDPGVDLPGRTCIIPSMNADTPPAVTSVSDGPQAVPFTPNEDSGAATSRMAHRRTGNGRHSGTCPKQRTVEVVDGVKVIRIRALVGLGTAADRVE